MDERERAIEGFIAAAGWKGATRRALPGDASARRYWRLCASASGRTAMVMDAPPGLGLKTRAFLALAGFLGEHGFSAPRVLEADEGRGLVLLEDLGDDLFARVCARDPARQGQLYEAAVDLLTALHAVAPPEQLAPYGRKPYRDEAALLWDWYLCAATGSADPGPRDEFLALIDAACADLVDPEVCVLRDYHAENLIWLPTRRGVARVGLLDFQDALAGHPAYDLVSLLEDARRDTSEALREAMVARYLRASGREAAPFLAAHAALGAQRNLKILGIFVRLWRRDGRLGYLDLLPRVWGHLQRDLAHPALGDLRAFVARHVPPPDPANVARIRSEVP